MIGKIRGILDWCNNTIEEVFIREGWCRYYTREQFFFIIYRRLILGGIVCMLVIWALCKAVAG